MHNLEVTVEQEIADTSAGKPHVLLLGAGASRAALPHGDKNGRAVPLLSEVADNLSLTSHFPLDLKDLSLIDFEAAYSKLYDRGPSTEISLIGSLVHDYFSELVLPDEPNLYDIINLSLRSKDIIATFNWDPFLLQSHVRLAQLGITDLPQLYFLHGNVNVGFCQTDNVSGINGAVCRKCGKPFEPSRLLYPIEHKDYQSDAFISREWEAISYFLGECSMFTVFGYSAPTTDQEAISLLKAAWGKVAEREMEQTEVINKPGADHDQLRQTWSPFINSHHYDILESFFDSFIAKHPRRSIEAYWQQNFEAKFVTSHTVPQDFASFEELITWFQPLLDAERY